MSYSYYKRTTSRQAWDESAMQQAVMKMTSGTMGFVKASKQYGVPQTTLERRVKKVNIGLQETNHGTDEQDGERKYDREIFKRRKSTNN